MALHAEAGLFGRKDADIAVSREDALKIGRKIWMNECSGTIEGLTSWNRGEDFASLGIGHFIWYVEGKDGRFEESWPKLIAFMKERGMKTMPRWIAETPDCPWPDYASFQAAQDSAAMADLRQFLASTIELQTEFIVMRLQAALPKMTDATDGRRERRKLERNFYAVAESPQGLYALIDYVNFKGEGVNPGERYQGQGWGLAQVLLEMRGHASGAAAAHEFSEAAKRTLRRRIQLAPRDETQWLRGWMNRCETYKRPL